MSQNTTNDPGHPDNVGPGESPVDTNPYFQAGSRQQEPDLDASAPSLRSEENQRLNRKALLFLGGIVLLLIVMGALMFANMGKSKEDDAPKIKAVAPFVPTEVEGSRTPPLPPSDPIALDSDPLPPLPSSPPPQLIPLAPVNTGMEIPRGPTLVERRMADGAMVSPRGAGATVGADPMAEALASRNQAMMEGLRAAGATGPGQASAADNSIKAQLDDASQASFLRRPDTLLLRGTFIRCILETRIVTDYSGFTSCIVTEPVYSVNGASLLLPKGSKLSGTYNGGGKVERVGVVWDRITTPTGIDVRMSSPGVDNLGGAGHPGDLDNHWGSRIGSALMVSLLADAFKYAAAKNGPESTAITDGGTIYSQPYESATARTVERMAGDVVQQAMSRPPTVTINQGTMVNVYVAKDVDFSGVILRRR